MKNTSKLQLMSFLGGLYFYIPIFALYFGDYGVSVSSVIFSQVLYSVFSFLGEIPTGMLADRFGQKKSVIIGYFLEMVGVAMLLLFPTELGLFCSYSLRGVASSFISGSEESLLFESCKTEKSNYKKLASNCSSLELVGTTLAVTVAGFLLQYQGKSAYQILLLGTVVALLLVFIISLTIRVSKTEVEKIFSIKELLSQTADLIRSNDTIKTLVLVSLLTLNGQYFLQAIYPIQFENVQLEPIWIGLALSIGGVTNILLSKFMYKLEQYFTYEKILLGIHLLMGGGYLLIGTSNFLLVLIGFFVSWGLFNSHNSVNSDYINQEVDSSIRSTVLSSLSFVKTGGQIVARLILGGMVGMLGVQSTLIAQGIYLLLGIGISYWLLVKCGCVNKIEHIEE